jgi:hypothetical protein
MNFDLKAFRRHAFFELGGEVDFCEDEQRPQDVQLKDLLK